MRLSRWLATAAATALAAASLFTGTATAAPAAAPAATAPAVSAAAAPTAPKYFVGAGYGPWNIAVDAAWSTAYGSAANEGYPSAGCRRTAGPAGHELSPGYYQVLVEIYCVPPPPPGSGQIVGVHSGKCVDVKGANTQDGTPIQLYSCNGTSAQAWKLYPDGTLRALGKCMDVQYAKTANGSLIGLNTCHCAANQQWEKLPDGLLRSVHSGRCLDALGWQTGNGARLGIWDCTPHHTNQQWKGPGLGT
ncbi:ricin-type beta-trefoil lectin domain protein [Streptomyces peucetius]|uniref:Ricin-type beta-trefoil lectin domain protein n=1 Tax=Streptomyces peucetius TaxID=1950 RepID=A0ABY6IED0_STRPE|nr:ricin-type beta-trefoil lectin domain protein [Streptomyces peucetius]UYQ65366.1 ricin-type beta-trefoil lectin domain protein [Streptomyces peucetius]